MQHNAQVKNAALEFFGRGLFTLNLSGGSSSSRQDPSSSTGRSCDAILFVVMPLYDSSLPGVTVGEECSRHSGSELC